MRRIKQWHEALHSDEYDKSKVVVEQRLLRHRLPHFFEAATFDVFIGVLHEKGMMDDSDQQHDLTGAEDTIRHTGPKSARGPIAATATAAST